MARHVITPKQELQWRALTKQNMTTGRSDCLKLNLYTKTGVRKVRTLTSLSYLSNLDCFKTNMETNDKLALTAK